jgi:hypothetical protein
LLLWLTGSPLTPLDVPQNSRKKTMIWPNIIKWIMREFSEKIGIT